MSAAPPVAGVLALQGDVAEHARALREAGAGTVRQVRVPSDLDGVSALVMPGGESTAIARLLIDHGLDRAIPERLGAGMAIFGTCAGLILLATEVDDFDQPRLGLLPLRVRRNAYGRQIDSFETVLSVRTLGPDLMPAVFIRAPRIEAVAGDVEVLAEHGGHPVLCRRGRVLAATFHPELTADRRLHRHLLDLGAEA